MKIKTPTQASIHYRKISPKLQYTSVWKTFRDRRMLTHGELQNVSH